MTWDGLKLNWLTSPKASPDGVAGGGAPTPPTPPTPPTEPATEPLIDDAESGAGATGAPEYDKETLGSYVRGRIEGVRNGELGSLPLLVGILAIAIYFQARNSGFLSANNLVNLAIQMSPYAIIGMGVVFVLLLGEIDLSLGYVSGIGGVIVALLLNPDGNQTSVWVAIAAGIAAGAAIGILQGLLFAKVGIPSFIVTLAGLLGWNGLLLILIGTQGTVSIQDDFVNGIANNSMPHLTAWIVVEGSVLLYALIQYAAIRSRSKAGLPNVPLPLILLRIAGLAIIGAIIVIVCNSVENRGLPYVAVLVIALMLGWTFITDRTKFGRHVYAVGGNAEAARRAGIRIDGIRIAVFTISGAMAAVGGIVLASRLSSVSTDTGGGSILLYSIAAPVIGGTSLFGGRGTIRSAVLGAIVIAGIENGLGLLNVSAGTQFIVTALVLLAAVAIDSISRRGRAAAGRA